MRIPGDLRRDVVDLVFGVRVLAHFAVDTGDDAQVVRIRNFVLGHDPRAQRRRGREILADADIAFFALGELRLTAGQIVHDGIAKYIIVRLIGRHLYAIAADDD